MRYVLLAALLVVIGYLVYRLLRARREPQREAPAPPPDLANLSIRDARRGDVISLAHASPEYEDVEFTVDQRNRYESGNESWFELAGLWRGRRLFLEVYEDDALELSYCFNDEEMPLSALGLTEDDLVRMDERQSRDEGFAWQGTRFSYAGSGEIGFFKDEAGEGEGYYSWEFTSEGGDRAIAIEKWEGEPFTATPSRYVAESEVRVFRGQG